MRESVFAALVTLTLASSVASAQEPIPVAEGWDEYRPGGETRCARGGEFAFFVHEGDPEKVLINFLGGGACWDAETCAAGSGMFSDSLDDVRAQIARGEIAGLFDFDEPKNPYRGWTHVVVPYCTGDVHWGSSDVTYKKADGSEFVINHRGAVNARAALDWTTAHVGQPAKVNVTGCSAGSYGSSYWSPHVREAFPNASFRQLGESGIGVLTPEWAKVAFPTWNVTAAAPRWIPSLDPAVVDWTTLGMPDLYERIAAHYPEAQFAQFTTARDLVQTYFYSKMGGNGFSWTSKAMASLDTIKSKTPNFISYVGPGLGHCSTIDDTMYSTRCGRAAERLAGNLRERRHASRGRPLRLVISRAGVASRWRCRCSSAA